MQKNEIQRDSTDMSKICILTTVHSPFDIRIFNKEALTLRKAGYDVTLIAQHDRDEIVDGIRIIALPKSSNRTQRMTRILWKTYRAARKINADIYHFHDPEIIPLGLHLKRKGKKVIYDVHEDYSEDILNKKWIPPVIRKFASRVFSRIERNAVKKFNGVITATPHIKQKFDKLNLNVIDINNYPILNTPMRRKAKRTALNRSVNYIGAIDGHRGIIEMVRALEFTNATLVLVGTFTDKRDFDLAKSMKGWAQVDYRGQVDGSEIATILSESSAGLVLFHSGPNHDDSQPNKLFEYMAAGLPIIGSNFTLWKEIIEKNNCGICVNPLNSQEIANAIMWVLKNPHDAEIMGENGFNNVCEKYNWENESKKLVQFYAELFS